MKTGVCVVCGGVWKSRHSHTKYCSTKCCKSAAKVAYPRKYAADIPTPTVGAISELMVCVDLMSKGFHVFRAQSAACPCDLVAISREDKVYRIEVKTGNRAASGDPLIPANIVRAKFDILALVMTDGIVYLTCEFAPVEI